MRIRLQGPGHAASLLAELNRCRLSRQYCDVLLQVGNRTFPTHRAVLACAGTYFRNLFARAPSSSSAAFSLDFISPANFEKVLMFVYTGEILTDLIDVGVLYELAERLGVDELVRACHATFPDLQTSVSANCKSAGSGDLSLDPSMVPAAVSTVAVAGSVSLSAPSVCSPAASYSSLSSSAALTPADAASPLFQATRTGRSCRDVQMEVLSRDLKTEDIQTHISYGQLEADHHLPAGNHLRTRDQSDDVMAQGPVLQLKIEQGLEEEEAGGSCEDGDRQVVSESNMAASNSCSFPDSLAQLGTEACDPTPSSEEALASLQVEGGAMEIQRDDRMMFGEVEDRENEGGTENEVIEGTEEEQWRHLAADIIELSDDENFMEEDEEDEDDLVCLDNEGGQNSSNQVAENMLSCKACSAPLSADPAAIRRHAETHTTDQGLCRVCGASFPDHSAAVTHSILHVGVQFFTCDMCHLPFCSQSKLLQHIRQAASSYTIPQGALTNNNQSVGVELRCTLCNKTITKLFKTVRDHLLSHVRPQNLSCAVCHLPQPSLCSLLWHTLIHLSLPVFTCPHCACCFVERPLLDKHMTVHAEEAAAKEREQSALGSYRAADEGGTAATVEELHCCLCQQTFRSPSAFQHHLSLHTSDSSDSLGSGGGLGGQGWLGKRKADLSLEGPPSSCSSSSPREVGGLVKMNNLGLGVGMDFSTSNKFYQGPGPGSSEALTNGCLDQGVVGAGVRSKWYRCRYCGKRFAHSGEFTYHLRIHTGEKPYQCKVCLRFFRGRSTMICHLKTHAGALMYRCPVCGLFFSTLKLVSSHMEVHKDNMPPDFNIEQTFMYNDHSKEPLNTVDG